MSSHQSTAPLGKYFLIRNLPSPQLVLEIQNGATSSGAPVVIATQHLMTSSSTTVAHRLWTMNDETGTVCSQLNGYCLDIDIENRVIVSPHNMDASGQRWVVTEDRIQTLEDFEMVISTVLDGKGKEVAIDGTPCEIRADSASSGQQWKLEYVQARYFLVRSVQDPNKVFDVQGANRQAGARVIAYSNKNDFADNQLWYEDQRGVIRSKLNGFSLCAAGGENVKIFPYEIGNPNHQWTISASSIVNRALRPAHVLELRQVSHAASLLHHHTDTSIMAVQEDRATGRRPLATQSWTTDYMPVNDAERRQRCQQQQQQQQHHPRASEHSGCGKHFVVRSRSAGHPILEAKDVAAVPGTPVVASFSHGSAIDLSGNPLQTFYVDETTATIRIKINGYCMDVRDGTIVINPFDNLSKTQQWKIADDCIRSRHQPNLVMTLMLPTSALVSATSISSYVSSPQQHWDIVHLPARCFFIVSQLNHKVVDVKSGDTGVGTKVIMFERHASKSPSANQLWYEDEIGIIRSQLNGFVLTSAEDSTIRMHPFDADNKYQYWTIVGDRIQNRYDGGLVIDIKGANSRNGAHLIAYKFNGGDNQRWTFEYV